MLQKKGAIGVQFNWIFVLIVGALIIAFFMVVIKNQMKGADYETQITVQTKLNSIMQNAVQNPGSLFEITLKDTEMRVDDCNEGFYLNNNRNLKIDMEAAFSPDLIKSKRNKVLLWTQPWQMPFKITNFMYVTNNDVRYIIVNMTTGDNNYAEEIFHSDRRVSLPKEITKEIIEPGEISDLTDKNNYKIRLVFFDSHDQINLPSFFSNVDVSAVLISVSDEGNGLDGYGNVTYYHKEGLNLKPDKKNNENVISTTFLGRASLIGAIFAEDQTQFNCVMAKAYQRMSLVSEVLYDRTNALNQNYATLGTDNSCYSSFYYQDATSDLDKLIQGPQEYLDKNLYAASSSLQTLNHNLQLKSCATIY